MRINGEEGLWLRYTDSAKPVEILDRVAYAFTNEARECLVKRLDHVKWLLATGRYVVAGVEVADPVLFPSSTTASTVSMPESEPEGESAVVLSAPRHRGRPRRRR